MIGANPSADVVRVYIVRHGQTEFNRKKVLQGHLDVPLNDEGHRQASLVGEALAGVPFDHLFSLDLTRCRETSQHILEAQERLVPVSVSAGWRERAMGEEIEGKTIPEAQANAERLGYASFRELGEPLAEVTERLEHEWAAVRESKGRNVCVVTHGGVIRRWLPHLASHGYVLQNGLTRDDLRVPFNTSVTVVDVRVGGGDVLMFGNTSHLGGTKVVVDQDLR